MIPLGGIVIWAIIIIINRLIVFALKLSQGHRVMREGLDLISKKEMQKAQDLARGNKGVYARVLETCLTHAQWKRSAAEKSLKELLLTEGPELDKHLDTLAVIAAVAPLLGLLGTVTGMIRMFEAITRFGTGDPKLLAAGISEALITTEVGLIIAIPLLLIHNFLRNRRNQIQGDMEMYAMRTINRLWPEE
jgi:biopolymer transport protein ExbB